MISRRLVLTLLVTLVCSASPAWAQAAPQDLIKKRQAEMLYLIGSAVRTSMVAGNKTFIIGVLGDNPLPFTGRDDAGKNVNHLDVAADVSNARFVPGKRKEIVIQRFKNADDYKPCHMLFIAKGQQQAALKIAAKYRNTSPVLLVGNAPGLAKNGVPLNFYEEKMPDGSISVHLELNPQAARGFGFDKINPGLLRLLRAGLGRII